MFMSEFLQSVVFLLQLFCFSYGIEQWWPTADRCNKNLESTF